MAKMKFGRLLIRVPQFNKIAGGFRNKAPTKPATYWRIHHRFPGTYYAVELLIATREPTGRACGAITEEAVRDLLRSMGLHRMPPWHPVYDGGFETWC